MAAGKGDLLRRRRGASIAMVDPNISLVHRAPWRSSAKKTVELITRLGHHQLSPTAIQALEREGGAEQRRHQCPLAACHRARELLAERSKVDDSDGGRGGRIRR